MTDGDSGVDLLSDLEARYDDVLLRLEEMDKRVQRALAECLASRQSAVSDQFSAVSIGAGQGG